METPAKIKKLDEVVVNRIAAGEIIQRPANALKELIENSLDAKSTNIQITVKEGGLKLLQIQDNGTGIRKEDMEIVCERFTTSKLEKFDDLKSIATFGFRGEALASISHVALLTITTKTATEKCAYKAAYIDSKLKGPPKPCAGNQGTTILIENLFYNVATRRKALASPAEEFAKIADVVTRYSVHNPKVGFTLKKHGEVVPQVRTPHNSTKMNNVKTLYGNPVARELIEVEHKDDTYKFKVHALITNPNYTSKRMTFLLFINHRLVDSSSIRKMVEELYSIYLPRKTHPWCYVSLEINPNNVDVNVHPTKHEVRFLHEDAIIERIKITLDEKLSGNNASRTFYLQARMPKVTITKDVLEQVLPEYDKDNIEKIKKIHAREMIRTSSSDQKLDKYNFTVQSLKEHDSSNEHRGTSKDAEDNIVTEEMDFEEEFRIDAKVKTACAMRSSTKEKVIDLEDALADANLEKKVNECPLEETNREKSKHQSMANEKHREKNDDSCSPMETDLEQMETPRDRLKINFTSNPGNSNNSDKSHWSNLVDEASSVESPDVNMKNPEENVCAMQVDKPSELTLESNHSDPPSTEDESSSDLPTEVIPISKAAGRALQVVHRYYRTQENIETSKTPEAKDETTSVDIKQTDDAKTSNGSSPPERITSGQEADASSSKKFKSHSVNNFRIEVKLRSILTLRKEVEDNYDQGLREIISGMTFVGCVDEKSALIQSGLNLYICDTTKLAEELFYEIMLYDFENYGVFKFSHPLPLEELAMLGLGTEEAGWTEEDGTKEDLSARVKELLLEKADLLNDYFSINIDKKGNLKSLPVLLDKYMPYEAELPLYVLRLATEVDWTAEKPCFEGICRETAKFYSHVNVNNDTQDWKYVIEHVLYAAIKDSLLPPKHFAHDSTILQIASLPDLYKVFERC